MQLAGFVTVNNPLHKSLHCVMNTVAKYLAIERYTTQWNDLKLAEESLLPLCL